MPPKPTDYQTRAEYEAAVREYRRAMFPQTLPDKTPEQMKIDRVYGEDFVAPYDDDAPPPKKKSAMQGMRFIKENQDGKGKANKGGKKFPDLTGDGKVTFADILQGRGVKKAEQGIKYGMGTGMADEKMMEYGRKMMERGRKLMEHGKKAKVYQGGTGSMEAAVEEAKKQNPQATEEEIVNFLLNPEAGFQEGQRGRTTTEYGTVQSAAPALTYEQFFRDQYGYFPTIGEIPRASEGGPFRRIDMKGAPSNVYYTDLADVGDMSKLFSGYIDRGGTRGGGPGAKRFEKSEDSRTVDKNDPTYKGFQFIDRRTGSPELRRAVNTADDVAAANKAYADYMSRTQLIEPRGKTIEVLPQEVNERGVPITSQSFRVTAPQSQMQKTMGEKLMRAGMYIR